MAEPSRAPGSVLAFRNLILQSRDDARQLWVAAAPDTASLSLVAPPPSAGPGTGGAAWAAGRGRERERDPLLAWARGPAGEEQLRLYGHKIDWLLSPAEARE